MTGKELVLAAFRRETTPRVPWVPFVGVHGGFLIGMPAHDYLRSAEAIVRGQLLAAERYRPDGLPVVFDLQVEAEALGCRLAWAEDVPPSVVSHPLEHLADITALPELSFDAGRFPVIAAATKGLVEKAGDDLALYGLITGPFTLLSHLRGGELFLDLLTDPDGVRAAMDRCADIALRCARFYLDLGVPVVAVVDPMTSQVSTGHFTEFIAPALDRVFTGVRARGGYSSLFVCGDATRNLGAMCATACDNVSIDENI